MIGIVPFPFDVQWQLRWLCRGCVDVASHTDTEIQVTVDIRYSVMVRALLPMPEGRIRKLVTLVILGL
jgi:hypothetical protein